MPYARPPQSLGIPSYTHQVEVHRFAINTDPDEPWDPPSGSLPWEPKFQLVWAVIEPSPASIEMGQSNTQGITKYRLVCDPCDIDHRYFIIDPLDGWTYQVEWIAKVGDPQRIGAFSAGYGHLEGELQRVEGLV
jgi:hypothetical protein